MKQFVTLLIMILCSTFTANAQNYLDHLKKKEPGKGVVTVNQSKAIDELVNGKQVIPQDDKTKTTPQKKEKEPETQHKQGNQLKVHFPEQPVYVHFYSPRWICRMGNFRSLAEAQKMLAKVRSLGYRQACLVKGQITVQY